MEAKFVEFEGRIGFEEAVVPLHPVLSGLHVQRLEQ